MGMDGLRIQLQRKDWAAVDAAAAQGPAALPLLEEMLKHEDSDVRELALDCCDKIDGKRATGALVSALNDESPGKRSIAMDALKRRCSEDLLPDMLREMKENTDEYIRGQAALLIGEYGEPEKHIGRLHRRLSEEKSDEVIEDVQAAMARLGDEDAREHVLKGLDSVSPAERVETLERLLYVNDPALIPHVRPLLSDHHKTARIKIFPEPKYMRVCDHAVNFVGKLSGEDFEFDATQVRIFTPEQIERIDRYVKSLQ